MPGHDVLFSLTQKPQKYSYHNGLIDGLLFTIQKRPPTKDDKGYATGCLWINTNGVPSRVPDPSGGHVQCMSEFNEGMIHGAYNQTLWWMNSGSSQNPHWLVPFMLPPD